jgi:predicted nucleic acid-binding Zn ribbon protein
MSNKNCDVCGINEKACMHCLDFNYKKRDHRVTVMFWFAMGFLFAIGILLIEIAIS